MRALILGSVMILMSGCAMTIPSFYDDNESLLAVDVRHAVKDLNCNDNTKAHVKNIDRTITRFSLYSESKGSDDMQEMIQLIKKTNDGLVAKETISPAFCEIKKKVLIKQSDDIATAVMGRY